MLLAGDIGGTKTRLAVFPSMDDLRSPLTEATLPSAHYSSLEKLVSDFLAKTSYAISKASFGVAGPVISGRAKITNLPWVMEETHLAQELRIPAVRLLNDLDAMAHAVPYLAAEDLYTLNKGTPDVHGNLAVIAPGTGLGEAYLVWDGSRYQPHPSEGGHADFGPTNQEELDMLGFLFQRFGHISYELVCSGIGLPNIYSYFRAKSKQPELPSVVKAMSEATDIAPIIGRAAMDAVHPSPICVQTIRTFVRILGAEAGNLALKILSTGGIYISGGVPTHILPFFEGSDFMDSFCDKGRFSELLSHVPVHIVKNTNLALLGAAYEGYEM